MTDCAEKTRLRTLLKNQRDSLSPFGRQKAANAIANIGIQFLKPYKPTLISGYLPVQSEADPRPLMQDLERRGHTLALPVVQGRGHPLVFRQWSINDPLIKGAFGIPVPEEDSPLVEPTVCLVPGLGFDSALNRLGYGGGYFDRTLAALVQKNPRVAALGIAFSVQMVDNVPVGDHDVPMSAVISDVGVSLPAG